MVQGLRGRNLKYRMISAGRKIKRVNIISIPCNIRIKFILRTPPFYSVRKICENRNFTVTSYNVHFPDT